MSKSTITTQIAAPCSDWREVSRDEFYRAIGPYNVTQVIVNEKWPYTSVFVTPNRQVLGKSIGYLPEGSGLEAKKYYLPNLDLDTTLGT